MLARDDMQIKLDKLSILLPAGAAVCNFFALAAGISYFWAPAPHPVFESGGIFFLLSLVLNPLLAYLLGRRALRYPASRMSRFVALVGMYALVATILALISLLFFNFLQSNSYADKHPVFSTGLVGSYIFINMTGMLLAGLFTIDSAKSRKPGTEIKEGRGRLSKVLILLLAFILLATAPLFVYLLFNGSSGLLGWWGTFNAPFSVYYALIDIQLFFLLLIPAIKLQAKFRLFFYIPAGLSLICSLCFLLPLFSTPYMIRQAEEAFAAAFADDIQSSNLQPEEKDRQPGIFSLTAYFLGIKHGAYRLYRDVLYYDGSQSPFPQDKNIKLYFDAWLPVRPAAQKDASARPCGNPVLIRIHGGAWKIGDKGRGNMLQVNKYFAARGYTVFDIQYGLKGEEPFASSALTPHHVLGNFDIDDMVRHIGYFTQYLGEHNTEYAACLDSVFLSGGSAGGQLACAAALSLADGERFKDIFGNGITVKGLIPFYPANKLPARWFTGREAWINPELLVRQDSPPCLIFQGAEDGLVPPQIAVSFREQYLAKGNTRCALFLFPFAGHAADIYIPGYYNQIYLFYMERFLNLYR